MFMPPLMSARTIAVRGRDSTPSEWINPISPARWALFPCKKPTRTGVFTSVSVAIRCYGVLSTTTYVRTFTDASNVTPCPNKTVRIEAGRGAPTAPMELVVPKISHPEYQFIRLPELQELIGLKKASIYNRLNPDSTYFDPSFPRPVKLSPTPRGAVAWVRAEVLEWMQACLLTRA